jgi:two-component system, cell cycle sensor histidine kinase and response regulator CckA
LVIFRVTGRRLEDVRAAGHFRAHNARRQPTALLYPRGGRPSVFGDLSKGPTMKPVLFDAVFVGSSLQDALEFIVTILQSSKDYSIIGNGLDGTILLWNEGARRLYGYTAEEVLGRVNSDMLHTPEDLAAGTPRAIAEEALRHGKWEGIICRVHQNGRRFLAHAIKTPHFDASGRHIGYLLISRDVTNESLAPQREENFHGPLEEQFRQARERLHHVVASSPAVLFTLAIENDEIRGISWISDNVVAMLGYPESDTHGADWWMNHVHPNDFESVIDTLYRDLFTKAYAAHEYRFKHVDGGFRWVRSEVRLLRDAAGKPIEAVGSWTDITDRKQLEEQFRQSQKMEAVGKLAGGVAHDFNNLLTVITGYSEMLLGEFRESDPLYGYIEQIRKAGERAASLTRQLLAFSRKQMLVPHVLDLNALLTEMEKMLSRLIGEDIDLKVAAAAGLWRVKVDPGQMEQVVMNLAVNARDAMPQGGALTIETANVERDEAYAAGHPGIRAGDYVMLAVTDTGIGMDEATRARIFEPFFTTKGPEKGTGLGLATVYGIIKQSGGRIDVSSEPGVGAAFKIYLPRADEELTKSKFQVSKPAPPRGHETVLLIEDEPGVRTLARLILSRSGYKVLEAQNGGEALLICQSQQGPIDIMVTDVVMPNMSGHELAGRLTPLRPEMKVLYLSGYADGAIVHHGLIDAETPFLQKPFTTEALSRKVREVLDATNASGP